MLFALLLVHECVAQLITADYNALMAVYDNSIPPLNTQAHPRFAAKEKCSGSVLCTNRVHSLTIYGENVTSLATEIGLLKAIAMLCVLGAAARALQKL